MTKYGGDEDFLGKLTVEPLAKTNWKKFVPLFGNKGACGKLLVHGLTAQKI